MRGATKAQADIVVVDVTSIHAPHAWGDATITMMAKERG